MKKIFTFCVLVTLAIFTYPQLPQLWGTASSGGANSLGTIFTLRSDNTNFAVGYNFGAIDNASFPQSTQLCKASNSLLYGMASGAGANGNGVIFSFNPVTRVYTDLVNFTGITGAYPGAYPWGSLVQDTNGLLYGMTSAGGATGNGVLFSFDPASATYADLYDFGSLGEPYGSLMQASNGLLYGLTQFGGIYSGGNIFSFNTAVSGPGAYTDLYDFESGSQPEAGLVPANNGLLYGTTEFGGTNGYGNIFSFDPNPLNLNPYTDLVDFTGTTGSYPGANPFGNLVQASDSNLYGLTPSGGANNYGNLFSFAPGSGIYTDLLDFNNSNGANPYGDLLQATDGKLYGMTSTAAADGSGNLFSYDLTQQAFADLFDFNSAGNGTINGGSNPYGSLVQAGNGLLYGMTFDGGTSEAGNLFSFDPNPLNLTPYNDLVDFGSTTQAAMPWGTVVYASNGLLYGITNSGGTGSDQFEFLGGDGAIYSFDPVSEIYTELFDFESDASPYGNLMQASNDKLYGLTFADGLYGRGTIFSIDPASGGYTDVFDFSNLDENGVFPYGSLLQASNGLLYGMTSTGGGVSNNGYGEIFSFDPGSGAVTPMYNFTGGSDGGFPYIGASLVQASNGLLYGMAGLDGAYGYGAIFSIDTLSGDYNVIWNFDGTTGGNPTGSLIQASNGLFYSMTNGNNSGSSGVLFSVDTSGNYLDLVDFNTTTGDNPYSINGTLYQASDGNLYGGTTNDGANAGGTVFQYNYSDSTYTVIRNLNTSDGTRPFASFIELPAITTSAIAGSPFCAGANVSVPFVITGTYYTGNIFTAQLSNAGGSFGSPVSIGTIAGTTGGVISAAIPSNIPAGTAYRIRVVSSDRVVTGTDNGSNITVKVTVPPSLSTNDSLICASDSTLIQASGSYTSYRWNTGATTSYIYAHQSQGYWVTVTGANGCSAVSDHEDISVYPVSQVSISVQGDTLSSFGAVSYQWYLNNSLIGNATSNKYVARQPGSYTVQVIDTNGCIATSNPVAITGIDELEEEQVSLYPNPSAGSWQLTVGNNLVGSALEIFDDEGRLVFQSEIKNQKLKIELDVAKGIYWLRINNSTGSVTRKMVRM